MSCNTILNSSPPLKKSNVQIQPNQYPRYPTTKWRLLGLEEEQALAARSIMAQLAAAPTIEIKAQTITTTQQPPGQGPGFFPLLLSWLLLSTKFHNCRTPREEWKRGYGQEKLATKPGKRSRIALGTPWWIGHPYCWTALCSGCATTAARLHFHFWRPPMFVMLISNIVFLMMIVTP